MSKTEQWQIPWTSAITLLWASVLGFITIKLSLRFVYDVLRCDLDHYSGNALHVSIHLIGKCMVNKLNDDYPVKPYIVQEVMSSNADVKVACHSTLFRNNEEIFQLPDEMEYEKCVTELCTDCMLLFNQFLLTGTSVYRSCFLYVLNISPN